MEYRSLQNNGVNAQSGNKSEREAFQFLVLRASRGNNDALKEVCKSIAKGILFRTTRLLGNQVDAEDVTQEVLILVCSNIHTLREPKAFYVWLNSIIMNETNRYMVKNSKHGVLLNIEDYPNEFVEANEDFLPHEYTIRESDRKAMIEIIDALPEQQRKAMLLYYYDGMTLAEAAKVMGVSQPRVSRCIKFAQEKIKKEIAKWSSGADGVALGLAMLPLDSILAQVLQQEAALFAHANTIFTDGLISSFASKAGGTATAAIGDAGAKAGNVASASNHASTIATIVTAVAVSAGAVFVTPLFQAPPDPPPVISAEYNINLSGGASDREYVNPTSAVAWTHTETYDMNPLHWWITEEGKEAVLFSGDGGVVDEALITMKKQGNNGIYVLHFEMQDENGETWTLSRQFAIES